MDKNKETKKIVENGYDQVAHEYAKLEGEIEWPRMKWLNKLLQQLGHGASVLDLGCGSGDPADIEISKQHKVTGVDISETQLKLARKNVPKGNFIHNDAGSVDFPSGTFDGVILFYTLEHLPRKEHSIILKRINQWLNPGGYVLLSIEAGEYDDVMGEWLGVPMFISSYDPETMRRMVKEAGFEIIETEIEIQIEREAEIPFLWIFGRKR